MPCHHQYSDETVQQNEDGKMYRTCEFCGQREVSELLCNIK